HISHAPFAADRLGRDARGGGHFCGVHPRQFHRGSLWTARHCPSASARPSVLGVGGRRRRAHWLRTWQPPTRQPHSAPSARRHARRGRAEAVLFVIGRVPPVLIHLRGCRT